MFDEGQKLPHHYHRTKYESERLVREGVEAKTIVYRPGIVVGHSETGEMDKIDGPYYFFKLIQKLRGWLPQWFPLAGPELGWTNIVPVDYVAKAMDHIAHQPDLDGQAMQAPPAKNVRRAILADFGIPEEIIEHTALRPDFDTRDTERALKGTDIEVPELESYAYRLWD